MAEKAKPLTVSEAQRAIYIDFEGAELLHAEASNPRVRVRTAVRIPRDWHMQLGSQVQDLPARIYTWGLLTSPHPAGRGD